MFGKARTTTGLPSGGPYLHKEGAAGEVGAGGAGGGAGCRDGVTASGAPWGTTLGRLICRREGRGVIGASWAAQPANNAAGHSVPPGGAERARFMHAEAPGTDTAETGTASAFAREVASSVTPTPRLAKSNGRVEGAGFATET
jgi:hypothetical protein